MKRPDFLTSPGAWVRASSRCQSAAEYASPIERPRVSMADQVASVVLCVVVGIALAALLAHGLAS